MYPMCSCSVLGSCSLIVTFDQKRDNPSDVMKNEPIFVIVFAD